MPSLSVVHLVRRKNGMRPPGLFLDSYRKFSAGLHHELILILKGFKGRAEGKELERLFGDAMHDALYSPDEGFDIGSYLDAARTLRTDYLLFVNSFSQFRGQNWLEKLCKAAAAPGVGLVGATASWQSIASDYRERQKQAIRRPLDTAKWLLRPIRFHAQIKGQFPFFPNPHVRTNAFLIRRELLLELKSRPLRSKIGAYRFESGIQGLSRQIQAMDLELRVVGSNGVSYSPDDWPASRTFWCGKQENLLVSDNQTTAYEQGDLATRARLRWYAWRNECDPSDGGISVPSR